MGTLYDLLGALPNDDAEALRVAFRRAAKATHPDTNPGNPDAALRFRQLVRAHSILNDVDQRATYDQLLAIATRPPAPPPAPLARVSVYEKIHRGATNTMAATLIAAVLIGGYAVFSHVSKISAMTEGTANAAEHTPVEVASALPAKPVTAPEAASDKREADDDADKPNAQEPNTPNATGSIAVAANAINPPLAIIALPALAPSPVPVPADAKTLRERGIYAYRGGDLSAALAHFNLAIAQDPGFAAAYIDRGIVFYRMRNFDRAFADMSQAKQLAKTGKDKSRDKSRVIAHAPRKPPAPLRIAPEPTPRWRMTAAITP
ncbi:MAG: DnaJ domain-containing protein [Bradyrhizobium sp.]|uniref:DnaJ domain-containing protein n=1 Tax=Bradyrhizobium sp. TaxID=376 RepID=UPI003D0DF2FD